MSGTLGRVKAAAVENAEGGVPMGLETPRKCEEAWWNFGARAGDVGCVLVAVAKMLGLVGVQQLGCRSLDTGELR